MAKQQEIQLLDPLVDEVMQDTDFMSYLMNQVRASENDNRARQLRQRRKGKGRATEEDKRSWAFKDDKSEDDSTEYASKPNYFSKNNDTVVIPIENLNSPALDAPSKPSMLSRLLSRLTRTKRKNNATSPHEKTSLLGSERLASYSGDVSINNNEQLPPVSQYTAINELESLSNGSNKKGEASLFDLIFSYLDILSQIKFSNTNSFFRGVSLNLGTRQQLLVQKLNKNLNEYNLPDSSAYDAMAYSKKVFDSISHLKTGRKGLPTINYRSFRKFEKRLFIPFDADKRGYQQHQNNINQNAMIHSVAKANHLHTFRDGMCFNGTKFYLSMLLGMLCGLLQFALACLPMMVWASFFASKDNIEGIETLVWPVALVCFLGGALTLPLGALIACLVFSIVLTYKETINPMTRYFKSSKQNGIAKKHQKNFQRITCVSDKVRRVLESYLSQKTKKRSTVFKDISTEIPYSIVSGKLTPYFKI